MRRFPTALVLLSLAAGASCARNEAPAIIRIGGPTMGTRWTVTLVPGSLTPAPREVETLRQAVAAYLERIDGLMSTWKEDSELSRFNRSRTLDPVPVSAEMFEVLQQAERLTGETGGAFDVTVGPLVDAWGFGVDGDVPVPTPETLDALRAHTGMAQLELDASASSVRKRHPEVRADFSALAPGYAADRIADLLHERGFDDVLIDVGGELAARGHNEHGRPWRVGIELPGAMDDVAGVVELVNAGMATSGDYRNYREVNGRRLAHIIDPRSGTPVGHRLASATVVDPLAVRADALATALMVLGPDEGLALAERLGVAAVLVVRDEDGGLTARASSRFDALRAGD